MDVSQDALTIDKTIKHGNECVFHRYKNGDVQMMRIGRGGMVLSQERFTAKEFFTLATTMLGQAGTPSEEGQGDENADESGDESQGDDNSSQEGSSEFSEEDKSE